VLDSLAAHNSLKSATVISITHNSKGAIQVDPAHLTDPYPKTEDSTLNQSNVDEIIREIKFGNTHHQNLSEKLYEFIKN
jgi:hypothetical protein